MTEGKPVLIEQWLPVRELSIESGKRELNPRPPLNGVHVWWARAPLAAASGVTLTALLPSWSEDLLEEVEDLRAALKRVRENRQDLSRPGETSDEGAYRAWVLWMCGVRADIVSKSEVLERAKQGLGPDPGSDPYGYRPAFNNPPSVPDLNVLHQLLSHHWGAIPTVLDPTSGGGAIPYTSMRFGLPTYANDLNPVAVAILEAVLRLPAEFGVDVIDDTRRWGRILIERCRERLAAFFPSAQASHGRPANYLFANTISCPRTGGPIPLSPNWWLDKSGHGLAARPIPVRDEHGEPSHIEFKIVSDPESIGFNPGEGTIYYGEATSLWDGLVVDGDYVKAEAQEGRMSSTLYCVRVAKPAPSDSRRDQVYEFRAPTQADLRALEMAEAELERLRPDWEANDVLPDEAIGISNYDRGHRLYGVTHWRQMFTPRQLLVHGTFVEEWRKLSSRIRDELPPGRAEATMLMLALLQNKAVNWNSTACSWNINAQTARSTFDKHNYSMKWSFAEFEGSRELLDWGLDSMLSKYVDVVRLLKPETVHNLYDSETLQHPTPANVCVSQSSAAELTHLHDGAIDFVNIDPPYYDNVMYAELADFFYVWEKRTLGRLRPEWYEEKLTDKESEAVANVARFDHAGRRKKHLARFDYQQKMQAIFAECHRVLRDDGIMVVWFTHKEADAWDTLGAAMMEAGFTIEASWPVSTQPQTSLHHAKKNSAKSTVMLVCRKRTAGESAGVYVDDIEAEIRQAARDAVHDFAEEIGVDGVDLFLSTYGPTLSVVSGHWPVLAAEVDPDTGKSRKLRPEEALTIARTEVSKLRLRRLVGREVRFDSATDFVVVAWDMMKARKFPYDEARKLAFGLGSDVGDLIARKLLDKTGGNVSFVEPDKRLRKLNAVRDEQGRFISLIDAAHFLLVTADRDGTPVARAWLDETGYGSDQELADVVQALVNAVPRTTNKKGDFDLVEARALDAVVTALFPDVSLPEQPAAGQDAEQTAFDV